ncbi:MAG: LysM peptidoglycan-binding domain-containing protein [Anaerolineales bacterium]|nr:LysM peptidoglycan-binding domain-containing protein [Anaerolineales bacterium]
MTTVDQAQQAVVKARNELEAAKAEAAKLSPSSGAQAGMAQQIKVLESMLQRAEKALADAQSGAAEKAAAEKAAAEAAALRAKWQRHTVAAGETLSHISLKYYKTANRWQEIYEANKDVIGDNHNLIKPGQELVIPGTEA